MLQHQLSHLQAAHQHLQRELFVLQKEQKSEMRRVKGEFDKEIYRYETKIDKLDDKN